VIVPPRRDIKDWSSSACVLRKYRVVINYLFVDTGNFAVGQSAPTRISPRVAFQGNASGRPRANQNQSIKLPILVNLILSVFEHINAAGGNSIFVQGIPTVDHTIWKKYFLTSFWHPGLLSLAKWPRVPLLLQSRVNRDSRGTVILKSSIKFALFRLFSRVQRFTSFNLSR